MIGPSSTGELFWRGAVARSVMPVLLPCCLGTKAKTACGRRASDRSALSSPMKVIGLEVAIEFNIQLSVLGCWIIQRNA